MNAPNPGAAAQTGYQINLFLVRLWREQLEPERFEWRGELKCIQSGEVRYFRSAAALHRAMLAMLEAPEAAEPHPEAPPQDD